VRRAAPVDQRHPDERPDDSAEKRLRGVSAGAHLVLLLAPSTAESTDSAADATLTRAVESAAGRARRSGVGGPRTVVRSSSTAGALAGLADAAERAAHDGQALAVLDVDLVISPVALLDLFDHAGRRSAALVREGGLDGPGPVGDAADGWTPVRWGEGRKALVESVGTPDHRLRGATGLALGALRVDAADVPTAARLWRAAAQREWSGSPSALALIALTRGGVPVSAVPLEQFSARRQSAPSSGRSGGQSAVVIHADPWRLRLRSAARPVDGFYSVFVVRKVSRAITWRLLPTGVAPNVVTVVSLLLGLLTAVLCGIGGWPLLVVAAVLLQVSLVLDCVDGEIARYTRRFSPLGAWLDVTGDRLKENGVYAGLALWSYREGNDLWVWAVLAMALIAYRHFVDYGFGVTQRTSLLPKVFTGPLDQPDDGDEPLRAASGSRLSTFVQASDATSAKPLVHWAKKAIHLPIGERYLVVSLALLTGRPIVVFAALVVLEVLAVVYTTGGRILRSIGGSPSLTSTRALPAPDPGRPSWGELDHQLDLGPLARTVGRLLRLRPPLTGRLAWAVPSTLFAVEAAIVLLLQRALAPDAGGAAFLFIAAAAYRRYDIIYRTRDLGRPPAPWTAISLGVDGRLLLVAVVAAWWRDAFGGVLLVAGAALAIFVLLESTVAWAVWLRAKRPAPPTADSPAEPGDDTTSP
jgi:phosphatidylglycerophosphate synthase